MQISFQFPRRGKLYLLKITKIEFSILKSGDGFLLLCCLHPPQKKSISENKVFDTRYNFDLCSLFFYLQCIDLAEEYVPDLLEKLQIYAAPDKLCSETKICPSSSLLLVNEVHSCKICIDFTTEALSYIQSGKAETEVLEALHSQCSKLGDFSSQVRKCFRSIHLTQFSSLWTQFILKI